MDKVHSSVVSEFVLLRLSSSQELQLFFFVFFSGFYVVIVLGNPLNTITVTSDNSLCSPMYFLLGNLSFVDICQALATPKMIADFLTEHKTITFSGCIVQIFFIHLFTGGEMVLLVSMVYDRYVAICRSLCSHRELKGVHCPGNNLLACGFGEHIKPVIYCQPAFLWPQCSRQLFWDLLQVDKLVCLDLRVIDILIVVNSGILSLSTFFLLISSYVIILVTIWVKSSAAMANAFSSLVAHITVVILFSGPCIIIYVWPFTTYPVDKVLAIF